MNVAAGWRLERIGALSGYALEWAEPGNYLLSQRNRLFRSSSLTPPFELLGELPSPAWQALAARHRLAQRLLRFMFYNVIRLPDGTLFVTFNRAVRIFDGGRFKTLSGLQRPCRVLRGACGQDRSGAVYFGEYLSNPERDAMRIYRYTPGADRVDVAYTFPPRSIRHIHGIYCDPLTGQLWFTTGDEPRECRMLRTADGFRSVEVVGEGDESWRCVSLLFTADSVYYATDAEFQPNVLYRLDRVTGSKKVLCELDGPVYYSQAVGDDLFFAVTAELCPSQIGRSASLWHVGRDGACSCVASFQKDMWHVRAFMPGALHFPQSPVGSVGAELIFQAVGLSGGDGQTFRLSRDAAQPSRVTM